MKFRGHETFFIRKGWISKGIKNVEQNSRVFMYGDEDKNPTDILGIGTNMVKALRYWMQTVGITEEPLTGKKEQTFTNLGNIIKSRDRYIEEYGTLCLIHYNLSTNIDDATSWKFFFNDFEAVEFTREEVVSSLKRYLEIETNNGTKEKMPSDRVIDEDVVCIMNTYVGKTSEKDKYEPEDQIDCPLSELGLLVKTSGMDKTYRKKTIELEKIDPLIALAIIVDNSDGDMEIKIDSILKDPNNLGKVFNMDLSVLNKILNILEQNGYIKVLRTAGMNVIRLQKNGDYYDYIEEYYDSLQEVK